jgi:hypothetical protein
MIYFSLFTTGVYLFPQVTLGFFEYPWQFIFQIRFLIFDFGIKFYLRLSNPFDNKEI